MRFQNLLKLSTLLLGVTLSGCGGCRREQDVKVNEPLDKKEQFVAGQKAAAEKPKPFPKEIVDAWEAFEAPPNVGLNRDQFWLRHSRLFRPYERQPRDELHEGYPVFGFSLHHEEYPFVLDRLPPPPVPFGLRLELIDDAGLAKLSRFKNLRSLDFTKGISRSPITAVGLKYLANIDSLQRVRFHTDFPPEGWSEAISHIKDLRMFSFSANNPIETANSIVMNLVKCRKLEVLQLNITLSNNELKELANLTSLRTLKVNWDEKVTGAGIQQLRRLNNLEHLDGLSLRPKVSASDLGFLGEMHNLRTLRMYGSNGRLLTDADIASVSSLKNLEYLDLGHAQVTADALKKLAVLPKLRHFVLQNFVDEMAQEECLRVLSKFKLHSLQISGRFITTANGLRWYLDALLDATELDLAVNNSIRGDSNLINDDTMKLLVRMKWLRFLKVKNISDLGLKELGKIPSLEELEVLKAADAKETSITDSGIEALAGLKLKRLSVPVKLTGVGIKHWVAATSQARALQLGSYWPIDLDSLKKLEDLTLSDPVITRAEVEMINRNQDTLNSVSVRLSGRPPEGLKLVAEINRLHQLDLRHCDGLTNESLADLKNARELKRLNLTGTKVTDAGLVHLAGLDQLEELNLIYSGARFAFDDKGTGKPAAIGFKKLRSLTLSSVDSRGLDYLARMENLRDLHLGVCVDIADANALKKLKGLRRLEIIADADSGIYDSFLDDLLGLENLCWVSIRGSRTSDARISEFRKKFRGVVVTGR